jgi:hypothetical protein
MRHSRSAALNFQRAQELKATVAAAKSLEELEAIQW